MAFGGTIKLQGESEYKRALKSIKDNLTLVGSELKLVSTQFGTNSKSVEALTAKNEVLNKKLEQQKNALDLARDMLGKARDNYDQNAEAIREWTDKLNTAESKLEGVTAGTTATSTEVVKLYGNVEKAQQKLDKANAELEDAKKALDNAKNSGTATAEEIAKLEANVDKAQKKVDKANGTLQEAKTDFNRYADAAGLASDELQSCAEEISNARNELDRANGTFEAASTTVDRWQTAVNNAQSELNDTTNQIEQNRDAIDQLGNEIEDTGDAAETSANGGFTVLRGALAELASSALIAALNQVKDAVKGIIEAGSNFEAGMSKVSAVSGATGKDLDRLRAKAKEMGQTTVFSATDAAEAFNYMAMAGWKTEDMLNGVEGIMNLAAASGEDLGTTSDIVTNALTAMGYSAKDAGRLADVMAAASSNANTNVAMMGETFKYAAPLVGTFGYTMEDTALQIGLMANSGIQGEMAGTALRSIMSRLVSPTKDVNTALETLGLTSETLLKDSNGQMRDLSEVMEILRSKMSNLDETTQGQIASQLAGKNAMSGFLAVINAAPADIDKLSSAIENSDGAAKRMAETMTDNLSGDLTLMKSNLESLQITLYEKFQPALREGVDVLNQLIDSVKVIVKWIGDNLPTVLITATGVMTAFTAQVIANKVAVIAATAAEKGMTVAQYAMTTAQAALNAVMAANPIAIVILSITALVASFKYLWDNCEGFRKFWINLWEGVKKAWEAFKNNWTAGIESIKAGFASAKAKISQFAKDVKAVFEAIKQFLVNLVNAWKDGWNMMIEFLKEAWENIKNAVQVGIMFIAEIINAAFDLIALPFRFIWENCKDTIMEIWDAIYNSIKTAITAVRDVIVSIFAEVAHKISAIWNAISTAISTIVTAIRDKIKSIWEKISSVIYTVATAIKGTITNIFNAIKDYITSVWEAIKTVITTVITKIKDTVTTIANGIKDAVTSVFNAIKDFVSTTWEAIKNAITTPINAAKDAVKNTIDMMKNSLYTIFDSIKNKVTSVWTTIKEAIEKPINTAKETVKTAIDKIKGFFDFEWKLPSIKLPHFSIKGEFSLNPPSVPKFKVEWYAKAMKNPMLLDSPTIFGMQGGKFLGAGEAGAEVVSGASTLMNMIRDAVSSANSQKPYDSISNNVQQSMIDSELQYKTILSAFKEALREMTVEMDDETMGRFIEKTVANAIYN